MEPAASTFMSTRDSWPLQVGVKDLSSLHPVIVANCLDTPRPCKDFSCYGALEIVGAIIVIIYYLLLLLLLLCFCCV